MKRALLGLHEATQLDFFSIYCRKRGYDVECVSTPEEMVAGAKRQEHELYFMDINLGTGAKAQIEYGMKVHRLVQDRVAAGKARFLCISGLDEALEAGERNGLPAVNRMNLDAIFAFIRGDPLTDGRAN